MIRMITEIIFANAGDKYICFHGPVLLADVSNQPIKGKELYCDLSSFTKKETKSMINFLYRVYENVDSYYLQRMNVFDTSGTSALKGKTFCHKFKIFLSGKSDSDFIYLITHHDYFLNSVLFDYENLYFDCTGLGLYRMQNEQSDKDSESDSDDLGPKMVSKRNVLNIINNYKKNQCEVVELEKIKGIMSRNKTSMFNIIYKHRELERKGIRIINGLAFKFGETCSVCYEREVLCMFECTHSLCVDCLDSVFYISKKNSCPLCRQDIKLKFKTNKKQIRKRLVITKISNNNVYLRRRSFPDSDSEPDLEQYPEPEPPSEEELEAFFGPEAMLPSAADF